VQDLQPVLEESEEPGFQSAPPEIKLAEIYKLDSMMGVWEE
jgi:hypothetical protein